MRANERPNQTDRKQEALIAALLTEPTHAAATTAGIGESTLHCWLKDPAFRAAYREARRALVQAALDRLQAAQGLAVDTLVSVAKDGGGQLVRPRGAGPPLSWCRPLLPGRPLAGLGVARRYSRPTSHARSDDGARQSSCQHGHLLLQVIGAQADCGVAEEGRQAAERFRPRHHHFHPRALADRRTRGHHRPL